MSNRPVPDEFIQSRKEFGHYAISVLRANKELVSGLLTPYATLNDFVNPVGKSGQGSGTTTTGGSTGTVAEKSRESDENVDAHDPYLVYDILKAIDKLIAFTEEKYL
jgi:hypothetical protein